MNKKIAIRDAFGNALLKLGNKRNDIVALEADVGNSTKSILFGKTFPLRYFNVGISELNMVTMAAGMSRIGMVPFVNTFSTFLVGRGGDPIQSLIAYDKLNVKLCGTYVGMSDSYDGASHQAITDMAIVRSIPNMTVITTSDAVQTEKAVFAVADHKGPVYLRLSRAAVPIIYDDNLKFEIGKGIVVKEGTDITLISTGTVLSKVLLAAKKLEEYDINASVIDMPTIKPIDKNLIVEYAKKTGKIITVEEHSIYGGLYSAVSEVLASEYPITIKGIGMTDFAESGDYEELLNKYGFSVENIVSATKDALI